MRKLALFISLITLSACASTNYDTVKYSTKCGSFAFYGIPHACACLYKDEWREELDVQWESELLECRATARLASQEEISIMSERVACSERFDPMVKKHIEKKNYLCEMPERECRDKGYLADSSGYKKCVKLYERAAYDQAFAYCLDRDFTPETEQFSNCLVIADRMISKDIQHKQMLEAMNQQRTAENAAAWRALGQSLLNSAPDPAPMNPPVMQAPQTTKCYKLGNQVTCRNW